MRRDNLSWIVVSLLLLYPTSYAALRVTDVLARSTAWNCLGGRPAVTSIHGPRPLAVLFHPLIRVETALPRLQ